MRGRSTIVGCLAAVLLSCNGAGGSADDNASNSGTDAATEGGEVGPFSFDTAPPSSYRQVDRAAMPGVVSALITSQDAYNAGEPKDDAAFLEEIRTNLAGLHGLVDDEVMELGLTPCEIDVCVAQVTPAVSPDMIVIDPSMPSGFPNGRPLDTQVMDLTLAVLLLDLSQESITAFAEMPLNPPKNDKEYLAEFPYLALPHGG